MRVAIAWYGAEGQSSYRYFQARGHDVTIVTPRVSADFPIPEGAQLITGDDAFEQLADFDIVVRSSSVRPDKLVTSGKIWSATNEFFAHCPAPIIGVTGTKGKGTVSSMIAAVLRASGKTVHLVGNIGAPALDSLEHISEDDIVVYELSSFQLWDLEKSPEIAVVLMIEADHLDVHSDFDEYVAAKANIVRFQTKDDRVFFHPTNPESKRVAEISQGEVRRYAIPDDGAVYVNNGNFCIQGRVICSTDAVQLPGAHNLENACAALSAALIYLDGRDFIEAGLRNFTGLPHRLKFVREVDGVKYYDDSIATTPGSAIAAIKSFDAPKRIILGGSDKHLDYSEIIDLCVATGTKVVAIGQTGGVIEELCRGRSVDCLRLEGVMADIIVRVFEIVEPGEVVILSPASASFDQYENYIDRGEQFIAAVNALVSREGDYAG